MGNCNDTPGGRIRKLIDRKGMKDKEFAALISTNPQTLSRILNDKYPVSPKMAVKIAKALKTSPEYILCQSDYTDSQEENGYDLKNFVDANRQFNRISNAVALLVSFGFSITETIAFGSEEYTRSDCSLTFVSNKNSQKHFTEAEIISLIKTADTIPQRTVKITYGSSVLELDYHEYLLSICNYIDSARFLAHQHFNKEFISSPYNDDIAEAIEDRCKN